MTRIAAIILALSLAATPMAAAENDDLREGMDLLSQGTRLLLRGLMSDIEPALRELEGALQDWQLYHPPEILPNGDIIIRRKVPKEVTPPLDDEEEIDL